MKSYFILDCDKQQKIADSLYGYYIGITANREPKEFWNHLSRQEIQQYFSIPNNPCKQWFDSMGLKIRDMSFTIYNEDIGTDIHRDEPPVIAKIIEVNVIAEIFSFKKKYPNTAKNKICNDIIKFVFATVVLYMAKT